MTRYEYTFKNLSGRPISIDSKFSEDRALRMGLLPGQSRVEPAGSYRLTELETDPQIQTLLASGALSITFPGGPQAVRVLSRDAGGDVLAQFPVFSYPVRLVRVEHGWTGNTGTLVVNVTTDNGTPSASNRIVEETSSFISQLLDFPALVMPLTDVVTPLYPRNQQFWLRRSGSNARLRSILVCVRAGV